ncbi:male-enhanced antigen 1 [Contarinia nasturtii]|uniref:male-enhanced antigen 1 n=1 Tax=Contarinia nasturtii TaxID=265458 RepID=UPI0012D3B686|nr:male-enhanced antigen 1 [Contarinia nasturtii]
MGSPDSPSGENNISRPVANQLPMHGGNTTASDDSDMEIIDAGYVGYQPLSLDEETMEYRSEDNNVNDQENDDDEDDHFDYSAFNAPTQAPETNIVVPSINAEIEREVWNAPRPESTNIVLDSTRTEQIMSAMANFQIPTSNIPTWAQGDLDEKWKDDLLQKIRERQNRNN